MSQQTEERLSEIFMWYRYNRDLIPKEDLAKRLEFMTKALDCIFEVAVLQSMNIQALELRNHMRSNKLWLPNGVEIKGDLTKFG